MRREEAASLMESSLRARCGRMIGSTWFVSKKQGDAQALYFHLIPKKENAENLWSKEYRPSDGGNFVKHGRWMLTWGPRAKPVTTRFAQSVTDVATLIEFASMAGCKESVANAVRVLSDPNGQWAFPRVVVFLIVKISLDHAFG